MKGSAITELGPALFILLICILIPLLDLLYLGMGYCFGYFLHSTEIRELATNKPWPVDGGVAATQALQRADNDFVTNSCGLASFLGISPSNLTTTVMHPNFGASSYIAAPSSGGNIQPGTVSLTTTISIRPWLYLPFFSHVQGLGANAVFSFTDTKPEDENGQN
jgi:hypothetical protein